MKVLIWIVTYLILSPLFAIVKNIKTYDANPTHDEIVANSVLIGILTAAVYVTWIVVSKFLCKKWNTVALKWKKKFYFESYCRSGDEISNEVVVEVKLSKEEAKRLVLYGSQKHIYDRGFASCRELKDIYEKVYTIAVDQMTAKIREKKEEVATDPNWKADDTYFCIVHFPKEFEK